MNGGREEVLGEKLDETAVGFGLVEDHDLGVWGRVVGPAEDGGVEGLDAVEVKARNFDPRDALRDC